MEDNDRQLDEILEDLRSFEARRHLGDAELLSYRDGDLPAADRRRATAHLEACETCRQGLAAMSAPPSPEEEEALDLLRARLMAGDESRDATAAANASETTAGEASLDAAAAAFSPSPPARDAAAEANGGSAVVTFPPPEEAPPRTSVRWLYGALAACVALVTAVTLLSPPAELPTLVVSSSQNLDSNPVTRGVFEPGPCLPHSATTAASVTVGLGMLAGTGAQDLEVELLGPRDQVLARQTYRWDGHGDLEVELPPQALAAGGHSLRVTGADGSTRDFRAFEICPAP